MGCLCGWRQDANARLSGAPTASLSPTGLVRGADGRVVKDPDLQVQHTIALVFARFTRLGRGQKVLRSLRDDGVLLPRRQHGGLPAGQVLWRKPTQAALVAILHQPRRAGAFVYGRRGPHPQRRPGQSRQVRRPMDAWPTIHQDVYPAYISWEQCLSHQARLADHASTLARRARGAPRQGQALLAGLVVCGRCGDQLRVAYKPQRRSPCTALAASSGAATCLHVDGASLETAVVEAFFAALAPAALDLLEEVLAAQQAAHARWPSTMPTKPCGQKTTCASPHANIRRSIPSTAWSRPSGHDAGRSPCTRWPRLGKRLNRLPAAPVPRTSPPTPGRNCRIWDTRCRCYGPVDASRPRSQKSWCAASSDA